jgi:hypothetical protein
MNGSKANVKRSNLRENNSLDISDPRKHNLKFRPYKISYFFAIKDHILITPRLQAATLVQQHVQAFSKRQ